MGCSYLTLFVPFGCNCIYKMVFFLTSVLYNVIWNLPHRHCVLIIQSVTPFHLWSCVALRVNDAARSICCLVTSKLACDHSKAILYIPGCKV